MSLRLYLDDCAYSKRLRDILRGEPYRDDVLTPVEAGLTGQADQVHFDFARSEQRIVVTKDPGDFEQLHRASPDHPGIFAIYQDNLPSDMTAEDIARAIHRIEQAGVPIPGQLHVLNHWRY